MKRSLTLLASSLCLAGTALAADGISQKPGLWETSSKRFVDDKLVSLLGEMDNMTPEQKAQMEKMMTEKGLAMPTKGADGSTLIKTCIPKDHVAGPHVPPSMGDTKCEQKFNKRTATEMAWTFQCTGTYAAQGEGQIRFDSPEKYTGAFTSTNQHQGKSQKVRMEYSGKWLGADCGKIKPAAMPAAPASAKKG